MRIDFAQLDQRTIDNPLPSYWKKHQAQPLKVAVGQPYEVQRSVSPGQIRRELDYLQANRGLPTSTAKFIESVFQDELDKCVPTQVSTSRQPQCKASPRRVKKEEISVTSRSTSRSPKEAWVREEQERARLREMKEVKTSPTIDKQSKTARTVNSRRESHFQSCQVNVFDSLYADARRYAHKRELERIIAQEEITHSREKKARAVQISTTFESRYRDSVERETERKKRAEVKLRVDPASGRQLFMPDTSVSKQTYQTHFKSNIPIHVPHQEQPVRARAACYSRSSSKLDRSMECRSALNKSIDGTAADKNHNRNKVVLREQRLADHYASILILEDSLSGEKLTKAEKKILNPLLTTYTQSPADPTNKQQLSTAFKHFYSKLNHFDRAILDARLKRDQLKLPHDPSPKQLKEKSLNKAVKDNRSEKFQLLRNWV